LLIILVDNLTKLNKMKLQKLDKTDEKILNELMKDSKTPLRAIAAKLKVSFVTVMNRIKKLEEENIITGYTAKVNYDLLGYDIHAMIELRLERGRWKEYEDKIAPMPEVYAAYDLTGESDVLLMLRFKNTKELNAFLEKLQCMDFIRASNTRLVTYTEKDSHVNL
jgi:Lrp/AsnC family transcriptional regulator for asnA, asnC and gidA